MFASNSIATKRSLSAVLAASFVFTGALAVPLAANAQTTKTHHSWFGRHRKATTVGAGVGAYALAKHSKHGVFHRHPVLTGLGAAAVAHHYAKKHKN